jgi:hypothetical protein
VPRLEFLEDRLTPSTLTVTNLNDTGAPGDGSLRGEIAATVPGDTINFAPSLSGTIGLTSDLAIDRNLTILGNLDAAGNPLVALSRGEAQGGTDLVVNAGVTASVSGLTFTGGSEHALQNHGSLTLDHVVVSGNQIGYRVDFVPYQFNGTINNDGTLDVRNSRITNNTVNLLGLGPADVSGGGAGIWNTGTLTVADSVIANNASPAGNTNVSMSYGGGIVNYGGTATITRCTLTGNSSSDGGGIYSSRTPSGNGSLTVSASTFSGNSTIGSGGGIDVMGCAASITDCTISGNTASNDGGGIEFFYNSTSSMFAATLTRCTVANNTSPGYGGGLSLPRKGLVTVSDSTIAGNAAAKGAGIYVVAGNLLWGATLALLNSTVAGNQSAGAGGGLYVYGSSSALTYVTLTDTLVAGNSATAGAPDVTGPVLATSAYNIIGNGAGSTGLINGTNGNQVGTTASPIDPRLGPLQNNGGPTLTMALLPGSPAIDAGNNSNAQAYDQRGFARVVGSAIDIGAFEVQPGTQVTHLGVSGPASAVAGTPFTVTVQALNDLSNPVPGYTGTIHFTSSDGRAVLPADFTFTASDQGAHTFNVTLTTAGTRSVTVADPLTGGRVATTGAIAVSPAAAAKFILTAPASVTRGAAFSLTLSVQDAYANVVTGYTGTIHFASTDGTATLPVNYTFTATDAGVHTFTSAFTLRKRGTQTIRVTDVVNNALAATAGFNVL